MLAEGYLHPQRLSILIMIAKPLSITEARKLTSVDFECIVLNEMVDFALYPLGALVIFLHYP